MFTCLKKFFSKKENTYLTDEEIGFVLALKDDEIFPEFEISNSRRITYEKMDMDLIEYTRKISKSATIPKEIDDIIQEKISKIRSKNIIFGVIYAFGIKINLNPLKIRFILPDKKRRCMAKISDLEDGEFFNNFIDHHGKYGFSKEDFLEFEKNYYRVQVDEYFTASKINNRRFNAVKVVPREEVEMYLSVKEVFPDFEVYNFSIYPFSILAFEAYSNSPFKFDFDQNVLNIRKDYAMMLGRNFKLLSEKGLEINMLRSNMVQIYKSDRIVFNNDPSTYSEKTIIPDLRKICYPEDVMTIEKFLKFYL